MHIIDKKSLPSSYLKISFYRNVLGIIASNMTPCVYSTNSTTSLSLYLWWRIKRYYSCHMWISFWLMFTWSFVIASRMSLRVQVGSPTLNLSTFISRYLSGPSNGHARKPKYRSKCAPSMRVRNPRRRSPVWLRGKMIKKIRN